jgi:FAD/FMN-containing dehydrogenase
VDLAVDQRPAAVAQVDSVEDVVEVVEFARTHGLRIAAQGTGHGACSLGVLDDTILLKTSRPRGVEIDAGARRARIEAGAVWADVVEPAAERAFVVLHGSSPDVGAVAAPRSSRTSIPSRSSRRRRSRTCTWIRRSPFQALATACS